MKQQLFTILTIICLGIGACGSDQQQHDSTTPGGEAKPHGTSKEYTATYVCPMHCQGSGSEQAGTCPVCGMDYITQMDHVKDGHNH